jgi:hypothetical protein
MKQFVIFNSKQEFWTGQGFSKNPADAKLFCGNKAHSDPFAAQEYQISDCRTGSH